MNKVDLAQEMQKFLTPETDRQKLGRALDLLKIASNNYEQTDNHEALNVLTEVSVSIDNKLNSKTTSRIKKAQISGGWKVYIYGQNETKSDLGDFTDENLARNTAMKASLLSGVQHSDVSYMDPDGTPVTDVYVQGQHDESTAG